ncbi:hypothetical protein W03_11340 [Nitrosomonas sp. PY1]|uniref:penicillin-binding protein activator n=1 Tax=Nitrosomonas sp. PY1 TaxID=1803906 RepID=UPI001FC86A8C|nr:penicillin-binding protein activator [Nitrosomonas sp. PY1]GKS69130.1 hypothetical protein W03_11340 [Nitrosomonas sp. PY1]
MLTLSGNLASATTDTYFNQLPHQENISESTKTPHIALILPLESPTFSEAADQVKAGFIAATMREEPLQLVIRIYSTSDDPLDSLLTYHEALDAGAEFVVGPLTRDSVAAIASSKRVTVPTLALNTIDSTAIVPTQLFLFGLQMEAEASQVAQLARDSGKTRALIIGDNGGLSKRLQTAFSERWQREGGALAFFPYVDDQQKLQQLKKLSSNDNQLVFLALSADKARVVRPYIAADVPIFATSQVYAGNDNALLNNDLNEIHFVDMPWLLQPDHPAVMAYRQNRAIKNMDMERLYALGIDAFRLMTHLLDPLFINEISFDGVTGLVRAVPANQFIREPVSAQFIQGQVRLLNPQRTIPDSIAPLSEP